MSAFRNLRLWVTAASSAGADMLAVPLFTPWEDGFVMKIFIRSRRRLEHMAPGKNDPRKNRTRKNRTASPRGMLAGGSEDFAKDTPAGLSRRVSGDMAGARKLDSHSLKGITDLERDTENDPGEKLFISRNQMEHFAHFIHLSNLGMHFNPFPVVP
jgi:hypothetical protein